MRWRGLRLVPGPQCGPKLMKFGEWGKFPKRMGRVRMSRHAGKALCSQRIYLRFILNRVHYYMKNNDIYNLIQVKFLICTAWLPTPKDRELWARYRSGPR